MKGNADLGDPEVLRGGRRVAEFLREFFDDDSITVPMAYEWIRSKKIPGSHVPGIGVIASPRKLREHFARLTGRAA